ncbi:MAG: ABC transporter permease, partial [Acidobacteria bacterium]|nr:ABC transporter permease [Acidobacteriota bacterium]
MRAIRRTWRRLLGVLPNARHDQDLAEEIESHIAMLADDLERQGLTAQQARRAAALKLDGVESTKEAVRDQRGLPWLDSILSDVRYALRGFLRTPGFTLTAMLTLALGIGANTAIFSALYAVVLRPLPFRDPDRLVKIDQLREGGGFIEGGSWQQYDEWRREATAFEDLAAYKMQAHEMVGYGDPRQLWTLEVSGNFFSLVGAQAQRGRTITQEDATHGDRSLVISHRLWLSAFHGDDGVIGRQVRLSGASYTVVGVMPERFRYPPALLQVPGMSFEAWEPMPATPSGRPILIGRLSPDATVDQARAELDILIQRESSHAQSDSKRWNARLTPVPQRVNGHLRPAAWILFASVALVLLITCANVASLLLSRVTMRGREIAVRNAIGAGRARLVRQVLTEGLLLSLAGAAFGVLWAYWAMRALIPLFPHGIPRVEEIELNLPVLVFTVLVAVGTTLLFGLAPAIAASRISVFEALKAGGSPPGSGRTPNRWLFALVAGEAALSVVLLVGAGLLLRSLHTLVHLETGFRASNVLTVRLNLAPEKYPDWPRLRAFHAEALANLRAIPGVESAALAEMLPLSGRSIRAGVVIDGVPDPTQHPFAEYSIVTPGYFQTMQTPLLAGRVIGDDDKPDSPAVAVISRSAAERFWPGESPLGKRIQNTSRYTDEGVREVIGVVEDESHWNVWRDPDPKVYIPYAQAETEGARNSLRILTFALIRTSGDPANFAAAARKAIWEVDPVQPIVELKPMQQLVDDSLAVERFQSVL